MKLYLVFGIYQTFDDFCNPIDISNFYGAFSSFKNAEKLKKELEDSSVLNEIFVIVTSNLDHPEEDIISYDFKKSI